VDALWEQFRAVATSGEHAWPALAAALMPVCLPIAKHQPIGRLRDQEDSAHEIVTRLLERLHANEFSAIKKLCATDPAPPLSAWLRIVIRRSAIDFMRESPEYQRGNSKRDPRWISLATLTSTAPAAGPDSLAEKRTTLVAFLRATVASAQQEHAAHGDDALGRLSLAWSIPRLQVRRLLQRGTDYLRVLDLVLAGSSHADTGKALGITTREVELLVGYIEELLAARRFNADS